jgi:hypothetical protein
MLTSTILPRRLALITFLLVCAIVVATSGIVVEGEEQAALGNSVLPVE